MLRAHKDPSSPRREKKSLSFTSRITGPQLGSSSDDHLSSGVLPLAPNLQKVMKIAGSSTSRVGKSGYTCLFSLRHISARGQRRVSGCRVFRSLVRHGGLRQVDLVLSCLSPEFTRSESVLGRYFSTLLGKIWGVVRQVPSVPGRLAGRGAGGRGGRVSGHGVQVEAGPSLCACS